MSSRRLFGLVGNEASTDPEHSRASLRGRRYAIPFDLVWNGTLRLIERDRPRWEVTSTDDGEGVIDAEATTRVFGFVDDVRIRIGLDSDAQTRVDMRSASRVGWTDLGTNPRRIRKLLRDLDRELEARPRDILSPKRADAGRTKR